MDEVISQDKRHTLPVDSKFPFEVAKEMPKVNVEELRTKVKMTSGLWIPEYSYIWWKVKKIIFEFDSQDI